jgi:hypothetical protein
VFSALGWNLLEMDEVRREYRRKPQDNPVDYALLPNRTECLLVEAKSLEKDLSDHKWLMQNLWYATEPGVQWCVLTNGDEYRIYNAHAPVGAEERLFRSVRVSETESKFLSGTLLLLSKDKMRGSLLNELWKVYIVDRNVRLALEKLIAADVINAPLDLEREYKGVHLTAVIERNGKVVFAGEPYDSLSTAAGMARKQVIGAPAGSLVSSDERVDVLALPQRQGRVATSGGSSEAVP